MHNIAIRADGGPEIGMGHIMRCLSLAKAFEKEGCQVCFFSRYDEGIKRINAEGFKVIQIDEPSLSEESEKLIRELHINAIQILIVDTYNISEGYLLQLKSHVKKLAYIDDINKFVYPADIIINGNITGEYMGYKPYSRNETMLLGLKYNLIREEFKGLPQRCINEEIREIMLTTGGTDIFDLSTRFTKALLEDYNFKSIKINIVVGGLFENKESLYALSKEYGNVVLHENVKRMSEIMLNCDVAISAGGSTLYELSACGTPALAFIMADNQEFIVEKMSEKKYIDNLGWHHRLSDKEFVDKVKSLCSSYSERKEMSERMQKLVDGNGAARIVEEVLQVMEL